MTKVLIVDDHAMVRGGLKEILVGAPEIEAVAEAADGAGMFEILDSDHIDITILDLSLREESGLDLLPKISAKFPHLKVLILSMFSDEEYAVRALKLGACGYLTKEAVPAELIKGIRTVTEGGTFVCEDIAARIIERLRGADALPHQRLSNREFQIMMMMAEGMRPTDIARTCGVSVKTISTHRRRILDKMGLSTTAQLMRYAVDHNLRIRR